MKANEINGISNINMLSFGTTKSHYKFLMKLGRIFPTTKAQVKFFISWGCVLGVLCQSDVNYINDLFVKHGFDAPSFKYTKSKKFVRLISDIEPVLRKEFNL